MNIDLILVSGIVVFVLLMIRIGLTVREFNKFD
jgi:hypothetical protein